MAKVMHIQDRRRDDLEARIPDVLLLRKRKKSDLYLRNLQLV
jgi:hypothetical protein